MIAYYTLSDRRERLVIQGNSPVFTEALTRREKYPVSEKSKILDELYSVIVDRKDNPREGSYTNYLFDKGIDKILKKIGEETAEVIIGSKNEGNTEVIYESADLLYHLMVLFVEKGITLDEIYDELQKRR
jgi:phosphoribosyl-ATP pyrophosphohydrolase/phosphoribosyl-AMP cyclohydrolase